MFDSPEITLEQAREIAAIDYPENPRGIGMPYCGGLDPFGPPTLRVVALAAYLDPQGRGVWIRVGDAHLVPCPRRVTKCHEAAPSNQPPDK